MSRHRGKNLKNVKSDENVIGLSFLPFYLSPARLFFSPLVGCVPHAYLTLYGSTNAPSRVIRTRSHETRGHLSGGNRTAPSIVWRAWGIQAVVLERVRRQSAWLAVLEVVRFGFMREDARNETSSRSCVWKARHQTRQSIKRTCVGTRNQ